MNKNQNNNGCGCDCHPQPAPVPPVDINMGVCDRNINMLPMLQTYTTKVLKPNINGCCKKNILTQQMMNCEDYKYVIKWDFDLDGKTITVPENCILEFDGGSLKNGTIIGQDTVFINVGDVNIWGEGLIRQGTWKEHSGGGGSHDVDDYIRLSWFDFESGDDISELLNEYTRNPSIKTIYLSGKTFYAHDVIVDHSISIIGEGATVKIAAKSENALYGFLRVDYDYDMSGDPLTPHVDFVPSDIELSVSDMTLIGDNVAFEDELSDPLFALYNCKSVTLEGLHITNIWGGYGSSDIRNFHAGILQGRDIRDLNIVNCEFDNIGGAEWMCSIPVCLHKADLNVRFDHNYVHDASESTNLHIHSVTFFVCDKLSISYNTIKGFGYYGSLFNAHGDKCEFIGNNITDSYATSVFDASEYGQVMTGFDGDVINHADSIICRDNYCDCTNSCLAVTWARHIQVSHNTLFGQSLLRAVGENGLGSVNPDFSLLRPTNELVEVSDNYCLCDNVNTMWTQVYHPIFVETTASYHSGGDTRIVNNYFSRDTSVSGVNVDFPFSLGNSLNLLFENNTIRGCYNHYNNENDLLLICKEVHRQPSYDPHLRIDSIIIRNNDILDEVDTITLLDFMEGNVECIVKNTIIEGNNVYGKQTIKNTISRNPFWNLTVDEKIERSLNESERPYRFAVFNHTNMKLPVGEAGILVPGNVYTYNDEGCTTFNESVYAEGSISVGGTLVRGCSYKISDNKYVIPGATFNDLSSEYIDALQEFSEGVNTLGGFLVRIYTGSNAILVDGENRLFHTGRNIDRTADVLYMLNNFEVCRLGDGIYLVDSVVMPNGTTVEGSGSATRVVVSSGENKFAFKLGKKCRVQDLQIWGQMDGYTPSQTIGTRTGILWEGDYTTSQDSSKQPKSGIIDNLYICDFNGAGITCRDTGYSSDSSMKISNCDIFRCDAGINISYVSEYHKFNNVKCCNCYYGCINNGGNNMFVNCDFSQNSGIAFLIDNSQSQSPNSAHGSCVACSFNHTASNSGIGIKILNGPYGFVFEGCQIFYSQIDIEDSRGIVVSSCNFGDGNCDITIDGGAVILFANNMHQGAPTINITNNTDTHFENCYNCITGTLITP